MQAEHGLGLAVIDYLQLMNGRGRFENRKLPTARSDPNLDAGGQKYVWKGKDLPKTVFEIAVTATPLTPAEEKRLRK